MIKYEDAELISVFPPCLKEDTDIIAISYAFKMAMQKLIQFSQTIKLYANIDGVPEELLDLMAIEMRCQYYDEAMEIEIKRNVIKNTLAWYAKGGTVSAVNEMIQTVFGEGNMVEWYEFDGEPGTFYVETGEELSPDAVKRFGNVIEKVKAKKSHLVNVKVMRKIDQALYAVAYHRMNTHIIVMDTGLDGKETHDVL